MTNNFSPNLQSEVFGLFELNDEGTVLYSKAPEKGSNETLREVVGRNFFAEVAPFENVEEFRGRLDQFIKSKFPSESFTFDCRLKSEIVPAKIMLVRITERSKDKSGETTIVDIRKI